MSIEAEVEVDHFHDTKCLAEFCFILSLPARWWSYILFGEKLKNASWVVFLLVHPTTFPWARIGICVEGTNCVVWFGGSHDEAKVGGVGKYFQILLYALCACVRERKDNILPFWCLMLWNTFEAWFEEAQNIAACSYYFTFSSLVCLLRAQNICTVPRKHEVLLKRDFI